jgi:carbonic anhydrase
MLGQSTTPTHTDCGMPTFTDELQNSIHKEVGIKPPWAAEAFPDVEEDVRQSLSRKAAATGKLNEVQ